MPDLQLYLPDLQHTLEALDNDYKRLDNDSRIDMALTLVEAVRFPPMQWKRFALAQAKTALVNSIWERNLLIAPVLGALCQSRLPANGLLRRA